MNVPKTQRQTRSLKAAALDYARQGIAVFPLRPGGKEPNCKRGLLEATTDTDAIEQWWDEHPNDNVGLRPSQGRKVIDVDSVEGHGVDGYATMAELVERNGPLPDDCPVAETPSGGLHYWLTMAGAEFYSSLGKGVDVKGHTGYVVAPPSVVDGKPYRWRTEPSSAPPQAPQEWVKAIRRPKPPTPKSNGRSVNTQGAEHPYVRAAIASELDTLAATRQGQRNNQLFKSVVALAEFHDIDRTWLRDEATRIARSIGLTNGIDRTITSAMVAAESNPPRTIPESDWQTNPDLESATDTGEFEPEPKWTPGGDNALGWHAKTGAEFILDAPESAVAVWGKGTEVLWAEGESMMIASPPGIGKTTLAGQIVRAQLGIGDPDVLDLPVAEIDGCILYLAMDRPSQIGRSMQRQFRESHRKVLQERLIVRPGPPMRDLAKDTELLTQMADYYGAAVVYVDSLKDAVVGLQDGEVGAAYNIARQRLTASGVQLCELHHTRKIPRDADSAKLTLGDLYGSVWLSAGAGSVILLAGESGDPIVGFRHMKPPMDVVGPFDLISDAENGLLAIDVEAELDLVQFVGTNGIYGKTAKQVAAVLYRTEKPNRSDVERARRKLNKLTDAGELKRADGAKGTGNESTWHQA